MLKFKIIGLALALVLIAGLVAVASGATGAYFSDTESGEITGEYGTLTISAGVNADLGGGLNFGFSNLLPGEPQSGTVYYQNSGNNPQDVYLVFPDADALKALNNYGTYASATITSAAGTWHSDNLTDYYPSGTPGDGRPDLYHVPSQMLLQSDLAPGASGSMTFTFRLATKAGNDWQGLPWNLYPIEAESHNGYTYTPSGTPWAKDGLPYQIVATQVGQDPGMLVHPPLSPTPSWF